MEDRFGSRCSVRPTEPPFHLRVHLLPKLCQPSGIGLQRSVDLVAGLPLRHRRRFSVGTQGNKHNHAMAGPPAGNTLWVASVDVDRDVHTAATGPDDQRLELDHLAHVNRSQEVKSSHIDGDAVGPSPPGRAGITHLIDPLHHRAAMHLPAEIHVSRFGEEAEGDGPGPLGAIRTHVALRELGRVRPAGPPSL